MTVFNDSVKNIIGFCAAECEKQKVGPLGVMWMTRAWNIALDKVHPWSVQDILGLAAMVEPIKNQYGFRKVPVSLGDTVLQHHHIPRQMENLVAAQNRLTPEEWYYEFELIHPFLDGNGRTGQILFNFLNGTLHTPVCAADRFTIEEKLSTGKW